MEVWENLKSYVRSAPVASDPATSTKRKRNGNEEGSPSSKRAKGAPSEMTHEEVNEDDTQTSGKQSSQKRPLNPAQLRKTAITANQILAEIDKDFQESASGQTLSATRGLSAAQQRYRTLPDQIRDDPALLDEAVDDLIADAMMARSKTPVQKTRPVDKGKQPATATGISRATKNIIKIKLGSSWEDSPNRRARELLAKHSPKAKAAIKAEVNEPEYVLRDAEIRDALWQIQDDMFDFVKEFFTFECQHENNVIPADWFVHLNPQTTKIIGCVGSGGPSGVDGWHDLFVDLEKRRALICAIMGNVIVEQVLQHPFFGILEPFAEDSYLSVLEEELRHGKVFELKKHFAATIKNHLQDPDTKAIHLPFHFKNHVNHIVGAIWKHLKPFEKLQVPRPRISNLLITSPIFNALHNIVTQAGIISLHMHMDGHTLYRFEPVFKDARFDEKRMQLFNEHTIMKKCNPHLPPDAISELSGKEQARRAALSSAEKARANHDETLVQISIIPTLTTYRHGSWEAAHSTPEEPVYESLKHKDKGFRMCVLSPAWVLGRWGRWHDVKFVVGEDVNRRIHGEAWKGGFVSFTEVEGVSGWAAEKEEMM